MGAKNQLTDALEKSKKKTPPDPDSPATTAERTPKTPPSRIGKKQISGYFPSEVHIQMKMLAVKKNTSIEALLADAMNLLFETEGEPPIA